MFLFIYVPSVRVIRILHIRVFVSTCVLVLVLRVRATYVKTDM